MVISEKVFSHVQDDFSLIGWELQWCWWQLYDGDFIMVTSHVGDFLNVLVMNRPSTNHLNESSLDKWLIVTFGSNKFLSTDTKINRNDVKNEKETEKWNWTFFLLKVKGHSNLNVKSFQLFNGCRANISKIGPAVSPFTQHGKAR